MRPFPFADPDRIVGIVGVNPQQNVDRGGLSFLGYTDLRSHTASFSEVSGYAEKSLTFSGGEEPEQVQGGLVSANLFALLAVKPILGRPFLPEEDRPGGPRAVLLSHALWVRNFGADRKVIGTWVQVDGLPHQVVGMMPPRFHFPVQQQA